MLVRYNGKPILDYQLEIFKKLNLIYLIADIKVIELKKKSKNN